VTGTGHDPASGGPGGGGRTEETAFASLLEDSAEDLYENAPCGYLSTLLDGQIARVNATLLGWLGYTRADLVGRRYFADLLTVGGRIYHETHFAPLLSMQGEIGGVALELQAADGARLPVLVTSAIKTSAAGEPLLIRTTVFDARDRRAYERELRDSSSFCTAAFGLLTPDGDSFILTIASGGHLDPLLMRLDGTASYQPIPRGLLIGVMHDATYTAATIRLRPGDTLVFYTDGLTEARTDPTGSRYGDEALLAFARNLAPATAGRTVTAITDLLDSLSDGLDDDTAVLAISVPLLPPVTISGAAAPG
jgi:PAS domain S-box-containing protein